MCFKRGYARLGQLQEVWSVRDQQEALEEKQHYRLVAIPDAKRVSVVQSCKIFKSLRAPVKIAFLTEAKADVEARQRVVKEMQSNPTTGSSAQPARVQGPPSPTSKPGRVEIMYKDGDDLRQDQFICQLIKIMDQLLKRENLDLRLTPYWVLPTSPSSGIIEFVPSTTLQARSSVLTPADTCDTAR